MSKSKLRAAQELIQEKNYDQARALLETINHDLTAQKWLTKLNAMSRPPVSTVAVQQQKRKRPRIATLTLMFLLACILVLVFIVVVDSIAVNESNRRHIEQLNENLEREQEFLDELLGRE